MVHNSLHGGTVHNSRHEDEALKPETVSGYHVQGETCVNVPIGRHIPRPERAPCVVLCGHV